jgi:hypothetical protein
MRMEKETEVTHFMMVLIIGVGIPIESSVAAKKFHSTLSYAFAMSVLIPTKPFFLIV